jgi:hypothetical protein
MREGVLCWYPFERSTSVLDLSGGALTEMLRDRCYHVVSGDEHDTDEQFDYIVLLDPPDFSVDAMKALHMKLNPHGRLLLAYENPFALRYWSGKRSPVTGLTYDSLLSRDGRAGKAELQARLKLAGFEGQKWYYPLTDHWFATEIYSDSYLPDEYLNQRFMPYIADEPTLVFDERLLYREIIRGGAFEFMCGAYLVEARVDESDEPCIVEYAAVTAYRDPAKRFVTAVRCDGKVTKTPLHTDGKETLKKIRSNHLELKSHGVHVVPVEIKDNSIVMPRLYLPTLWDYWAKKLIDGTFDESEMFKQFDRIRADIYKSSKAGKCFWELVPANCFYDERNDELIFFDQEYCWEDVSPDIALTRALLSLDYSPALSADPRKETWLEQLKERYCLTDDWEALTGVANEGTYVEVFGIGADLLHTTSHLAAVAINKKTEFAGRSKRFYPIPAKLYNLGFSRPIIYGYGKRGKELEYVLFNSGVEIAAIVDREKREYTDITQVPADANADAVIVSVLDSAGIAEGLRLETTLPVFDLEELLCPPEGINN